MPRHRTAQHSPRFLAPPQNLGLCEQLGQVARVSHNHTVGLGAALAAGAPADNAAPSVSSPCCHDSMPQTAPVPACVLLQAAALEAEQALEHQGGGAPAPPADGGQVRTAAVGANWVGRSLTYRPCWSECLPAC